MNNITIKVHGYCNQDLHELRKLVINSCPAKILEAEGTFVVIAESISETLIITSKNGIMPYYYFFDGNTLFHGSTISTICVEARLPWTWNYSALGDYLSLNHTLGDATLHPLIKRTNPGTILSIKQGHFHICSSDDQVDKVPITRPDDLIKEISQEVLRWWVPSKSLLSISGGLDSRLLLAILLASGNRPLLLVCGQDSAFDLIVAKEISNRLKLDLIHTTVISEDFVRAAAPIARQTNGLLPITHWPGVLFAKETQDKVVFVGLNGEIARSYYDDNGIYSLMRFGMSPLGKLSQKFWIKKFHNAFTEKDYDEIHPELAKQFSMDGHKRRVNQLMEKEHKFGLSLGTAFSHQYGRHKTGADIAALSLFARWNAPFLAPNWTSMASNLPNQWKLGSKFHRYAIGKLVPELLFFPEENNPFGNTTARSPSIKYWVNLTDNTKITPFFDQSLYEDPVLLDLVSQSLICLDDIISPKLLKLIVASPQRRKLFFQLGALALWRKELHFN